MEEVTNETKTVHTTSKKSKRAVTQAATAEAKVEKSSQDEKKPIIPKDIDPNQIVTVRNGFQGTLVYKSRHTGERFVWDAFGDEQDMELSELKNARSSNKKYFINNWFMFDEPWVADYLGMTRYYKFAIPIDSFDELFTKPASEVESVISKLSDGQKKSVAYRARQLISEGNIDSNKTIATLEKCLGVELVER